MYNWHEKASQVYVYLSNVDSRFDYVDLWDQLGEARWFSRGWTLQELLAKPNPDKVKFYEADWKFLETRKDLAPRIERRTSIPQELLLAQRSPWAYSIAQRMSWTADRETTRIEDRAYSLIGLSPSTCLCCMAKAGIPPGVCRRRY